MVLSQKTNMGIHANENCDWRIYSDFTQVLINIARDLYAKEDFGVELDETVNMMPAQCLFCNP